MEIICKIWNWLKKLWKKIMALVTINNTANGDDWAEFIISHSTSDQANVQVNTTSGAAVEIDWGDGTIETLAAATKHDHTYVSNATVFRVRTAGGLEDIERIFIDALNPLLLGGDISQFNQLVNLLTIKADMGGAGTLGGNITSLNLSSIDTFIINTGGTFVCTTLTIPRTIVSQIELANGCEITGAVSDLPPNLQRLYIRNTVTTSNITGSILDFPRSMTSIDVAKNTTPITGNIANCPPNLQYLYLQGNNNVTGDVQNLPSSLLSCSVYGDNTIFGDVANGPNCSYSLQGSNIISGNISSLNFNNKFHFVYGNNTLTGSLHQITGTTRILTALFGNNTIENFGSKDYTGYTNVSIQMYCSSQMLPGHVDQLIIDLNNAGLTTEVALNFSGPGAVRTSASDAAFTAITTGGGTINLTP